MNFSFEIPKFDFSSESFNQKEFDNYYGVWKVRIFASTNCKFFGFMYFKPAFEIDMDLISKFKVIFQFVNCDSNSYSFEVKAKVDPGSLLFEIDPQHSNGLDNNRETFKINILLEIPDIRIDENSTNGNLSSKTHLKELFSTEKLGDVTIKTLNNEFKVHKIILMRSEVFDKMLNNSETKESQTGIVQIDDMEHEVLYEMCRYLYTDEVPKITKLALDLLIAADKYNIPGLALQCGKYLMNNMAIESFYDVLVTANNLNVSDLKETAINFVIDNRKTIFASEGWKNLKEKFMPLAMEVMEKFVANA